MIPRYSESFISTLPSRSKFTDMSIISAIFPASSFAFFLLKKLAKGLRRQWARRSPYMPDTKHMDTYRLNGETTDQTKVLQPPLLTKYTDLLAQLEE